MRVDAEIRGNARCNSLNRRLPSHKAKIMRFVHRSPRISVARDKGQYCPYILFMSRCSYKRHRRSTSKILVEFDLVRYETSGNLIEGNSHA